MIERTPETPTPWHALDVEHVLERLQTTPQGLGETEARARLARHGPNRLPPPPRQGPIARFAAQFHNVLIYILLAAAVVTAVLGHAVDTGVILGVVVINALIGFVQEGKAERALEAIRGMLSPKAAALRDGQPVTIDAESLVPGDVVLLASGDRVPADLRLTHTRDLRVDEAILTGESVAVEKRIPAVRADAALGDRSSMAFSGTLVAAGRATGVVVATGRATEVGAISEMLARVEPLTTPLLRAMTRFGQHLSAAIVALAVATFAFGTVVRGYSLEEMFLAAVGLAVAAIPEGLPAIITITLAIGVQRMARRNAIIRRLPAVETLGAVTVICSDKTGTLTRNEMTARSAVTAEDAFETTGVGYDPHGAFERAGVVVERGGAPDLEELLRAGLLCNDARLREHEANWTLHGDPTEGALIVAALKAGFDPALEHKERPRTDTIPFESEHRFMATLHHDHAGHGFIYLKGAPERVLGMCRWQRRAGQDEPIDRELWQRHVETLAADGQRVLAVAFATAGADHGELRFEHVEEGLTLLGLFGLIDPPREEAVEGVARCRSAGIAVKMITGDHAATARAVARRLGVDRPRVRSGPDLDAMDDAELRRVARETDVFARASPAHKLRLVQALQAERQVVAMTGDGVNDAPALKRADAGVAMGVKGTEVSKESAEMVLADDNFASIVAGVEEGRTVYDNIRKTILFILPTNGGEALTILAAILLGFHLPITPVQILWVNMITAVTLGLALAFEPPESAVMRRPPRRTGEPLLSRFLVWRIAFVSVLLVMGTFGLFLWQRMGGADLQTAQTVAVNTLVACEMFYLLNARFFTDGVFGLEALVGNRYVAGAIALVIVFQLLFTYAPAMQVLFGSRALAAPTWGAIVGIGLAVYVLVEIEKALFRYTRNGARR